MTDLEPFRREIRRHCYRMTGSLFDAEDMVQETFLRAWKALPSLRDGSLVKPWLYRIATNVCLTSLRKRMPDQLGPSLEGPPGEPDRDTPWLTPFPTPQEHYERHETLQLAFATALQALPPRQRAALLLCDVLEWSARETAEALETTPAAVNSALQRARATLAHTRLKPTETNPRLLREYVKAWQEQDLTGLLSLLTEDVAMVMPPYRAWYQGRDAVRGLLEFVFERYARATLRLEPTSANAQPAFLHYTDDRPHTLHVLRIENGQVADLTVFHEPRLFECFTPGA